MFLIGPEKPGEVEQQSRASRRAAISDQYTSQSKVSNFPLKWNDQRMKETRQKT